MDGASERKVECSGFPSALRKLAIAQRFLERDSLKVFVQRDSICAAASSITLVSPLIIALFVSIRDLRSLRRIFNDILRYVMIISTITNYVILIYARRVRPAP